jgi:hypothetical protein
MRGAGDPSLKVTKRPHRQHRRLRQLFLGHPGLGPQLAYQPCEGKPRLFLHRVRHPPSAQDLPQEYAAAWRHRHQCRRPLGRTWKPGRPTSVGGPVGRSVWSLHSAQPKVESPADAVGTGRKRAGPSAVIMRSRGTRKWISRRRTITSDRGYRPADAYSWPLARPIVHAWGPKSGRLPLWRLTARQNIRLCEAAGHLSWRSRWRAGSGPERGDGTGWA